MQVGLNFNHDSETLFLVYRISLTARELTTSEACNKPSTRRYYNTDFWVAFLMQVYIFPLWLAPWLLSALLINLGAATGYHFLWYGLGDFLFSLALAVQGSIPEALSGLVTQVITITLFGSMMCLPASIPWAIACKAKLRSHELTLGFC